MKTKRRWYIVAAALLLAAAAAAGIFGHFRRDYRSRAYELLAAGDYSGAVTQFEKAGDGDNAELCRELIREQSYTDARRAQQAGDYKTARRMFTELGDYKDARNLELACRSLEARQLMEEGELLDALELFESLGTYPGTDAGLDSVKEKLYRKALDCACAGDYEQACGLWQRLEDYSDSRVLEWRCERALEWSRDESEKPLFSDENRFDNSYMKEVYICDIGYAVLSEQCDADTRFFIYFPGGRDIQISVDFLYYYIMNPAPNTIALFLYTNGLDYMEEKTKLAVDMLDRVAAECEVFAHDVMVCGSSLGAYPAMHAAIYCKEDFGITVPCVLSLDAGSDWQEYRYTLDREECLKTAQLGTQFYLFESPFVGMNRNPIKEMVLTGNDVTIVGCVYDQHERISFDALGMGVINWALGDRSEPYVSDIYSFNKLTP